MRRHPLSLLAILAVALCVGAPVAAQDEASPSPGSGAATGPAGEAAPIPYLDADGNQAGTILIREIEDPFTGFDPASPPAADQRYALLTVTFEAAEDRSFAADPYQVQLLDAAGYLHFPSWVPRPADATLPDLQGQELAPFDRVSGVIPFVLPADASVVRIVYRGDGSRFMTLAELGDPGSVAIGEPREVTDAEGVPIGSVTVREVMDPFSGADPSAVPPEGQRFVGLDVALQAADDQAFWATPGGFLVLGTDGVMYWPTWIPRPQPYLLQDVESTPLSPGDRVSGFVGYALPEGVGIDAVLYNGESDRFLPVADL